MKGDGRLPDRPFMLRPECMGTPAGLVWNH